MSKRHIRKLADDAPEDFWSNAFHWCALAAGFIAASEDRLGDSLYVRDLAYRMFEEGAFRDRVEQASSETSASACPSLSPPSPSASSRR